MNKKSKRFEMKPLLLTGLGSRSLMGFVCGEAKDRWYFVRIEIFPEEEIAQMPFGSLVKLLDLRVGDLSFRGEIDGRLYLGFDTMGDAKTNNTFFKHPPKFLEYILSLVQILHRVINLK